MLNYEEELKKFKPALAVNDVEDNVYSRDMTDVIDLLTGDDLSVRDARYNIIAADLLGEETRYDFRAASSFDSGGYDVRVLDMIAAADADDTEEEGVSDDEDPDDLA